MDAFSNLLNDNIDILNRIHETNERVLFRITACSLKLEPMSKSDIDKVNSELEAWTRQHASMDHSTEMNPPEESNPSEETHSEEMNPNIDAELAWNQYFA
jgi:hypothetical protein